MSARHRAIFAASLVAGLAASVSLCSRLAAEITPPLKPAEAVGQFQLDEGLRIELVACEPEVVDPIAVRFDEDGRMWVVEMRDYPHGPPAGSPPLSTIRVLTDQDADGRYESSRVFADELLFPTGLQPWRGGVIVTLAGEVAYLKDADGDGRAEVRETWFRGFAAENPQLRANHPRFGLDHRVYLANGLRGGAIVDARRPHAQPVSISGRDFRFDPRTGACEAVSGNGQFGLTFDDFGNRFVCSNRQPLDHVVLENEHLARNPFLALPGVLATVAAAGEESRVLPLTRAWTTSNLHAGQFTAACGVEIYRGGTLGDSYANNAFVCEPTGNLVHREILSAKGVTFVSRPADAAREFLAARDPWFRPVNLEVGPDGALYVVDMYRAVIEHPEFMPSELQQRPDLRAGDDRGRIYRIVPAAAKPRSRGPRLSRASTVDLVKLLEHNNAWWRETAARLLYERADPSAAAHLERLAREAAEPAARVAALWALSGQGALAESHVVAALEDRHPRVREQGVALAEPRLAVGGSLKSKVLALAADDDARVRFRSALSIGGLASAEVVLPLTKIALARPDDEWTRRAIATARPEHIAPILVAVLNSSGVRSALRDAPETVLTHELATIVGARGDTAEVARILLLICTDETQLAAHESALQGLGEGLKRHGGLVQFAARLPDPATFDSRLTTVLDRATRDVLDEAVAEDARAAKLRLLAHARSRGASEACLTILRQSPSQRLRILAARALADHSADDVPPALLEVYAAQTPAVRRTIVDALIVAEPAAKKLLAAVRSGQIARGELDTARETRLRRHRDAEVRKLAAEILSSPVAAQRSAVLAEYQSALSLVPDVKNGKELFRQHCAACHHVGDVGVDVAPDISDSRVKTTAQLLTDILHPNQAIDNNYVSYTVVTGDGNVHTGIIAAETAASVTLRQAENKTLPILRADIETIQTSGMSLMPEGFEKHLSRQQMADVIGFVKNWRYLDEPIPATIGPRAK